MPETLVRSGRVVVAGTAGVIELPTEAVGFHGTDHGVVPQLVAHEILLSDNAYDWLGKGFYIWQDSPWRAHDWAVEQHGANAAVVAVRISLDGCLDLLNPNWQELLAAADAQFVLECLEAGAQVPVNTLAGHRARDRATINWFCEQADEQDQHVRSVRAIFEEGEPLYETSGIRTQSHIQIAVRDPSVILEIEEATW
jgi:hypothetical protein